MKSLAIKAAILYAVWKFAPNAQVKAAALGVVGVMAAGYVPYLNGKDLAGKAVE